SQHLEGELNDILAGDAHPGFHLFATINPPEYSGRKPLSPALKGRFRHIPIRQYNPAELRAIAEKVLPQTWHGKIVAEWLTEQHCRLRACLQRQNLPLQPTSLDLQNAARAIVQGGDFTKDGLHQCLNQHYRLYLMAAGISLGALPKSSALATSKSAFDYQLWDWFNHMVSDIERPWVIRRSDLNSIDEKRHEIRVETRLTEEEARTEIIRMVAQARWQASGLSLKPDQSDDMLTKALYVHWQRRWFDHEFGHTGMDVNSVFPLTKEQEQTLKISTYQPFLQEADQRISARSSGALPLRPAFWYQIIGQSNPVNRASTIATDNAAEQYDPEVHEKQAPALNRTTNYEYQEKSQLDDYKIFDCYHSSRLYRHLARDIYVTAKGDVKEIDLNDKDIDGVETLIPERLPGQDQPVLLTSDQALATFSCSSKNGQYALPSLNPDDYIVALRIEPDMAFTLIRDRYTGLHTLSVPDAKANQSIQVTYVVESRVASKQTLTKEALQEQSTRFDTHCSEGMKNVLDELFKTIGQQLPEVQAPLQAIKNAKDKTQLIRAITDYCAEFSGEIQPESHENFFKFLVTKRQGSCHHRVTVFIAFCRYFGIPCRLIDNFIHCFAEYSEDGGQTWKSVDLGGGPAQVTTITPAFQPNTKGTVSSTELKKTLDLLKEFLKGADLTQQQTLAKACGMSLMELNNALATKSALPKTHLSIFEIVRNLWKEKNLTGFVMGVSMLESLETETPSGYGVIWSVFLAYNEDNLSKPMSEAIKEILSNSDEDQVTEQLKSLHSKMIVHGGANPLQWFHLILDILKHIDLTRPSVIQFVRKTLKSGWLDQPPINDFYTGLADIHHETLVRLEAVDEVKFEAAHALKMWYRKLFSREKNSQTWRLVYKSFQSRKGEAWFVTHCHDGFSSFLTYKIIQSSLQIAWTDDPEGVPNIERMLVHHPAFAKLSSGKANHRPVIILGEPSWGKTVIAEKVRVLFHRKVESSPDLKQITEKIKLNPYGLAVEDYRLWNGLRYKYQQAIQQAFSYYLYEMTHSKAGGLTYCWAKATMIDHITPKDYLDIYGAHEPSSPEELYAMMYKIDSSDPFAKSLRDTHLRQALNAGNALVLRSDELTKIAEEFLNSV
ncbi:transglutaminase-like domain-containing protein, partial [Endozoicomonas sp. SESOKO2]|uniref:transglutaminase-like domain-containing protein n=1 Tax=Endozoicomonas sp. SESOKO2 TaxID=2828743 RepID=UPI002147AB22